MTFQEFQDAAKRTHDAPFPNCERLPVMALGLCGEAGEVADLIKKHMWHGKAYPQAELIEELGDALWYIADIATSIGVTLDEIAAGNIEKIRRRYPDGFTVGGGIR
jgi:NTP pyrophosphatase (non-canonical NTP hydrolase)